MAILPQNLNYSDKDFASIRARLFALIASVFPTWTDQNVANFGNLLLELNAWIGDALGFTQDNQARESRLGTAQQLKNVLALAQMLGYTPSGNTAALALETITLAAPPAYDVDFPAGTIFSTANVTSSVSFQSLADATIAAGANPPTVQVTVENSANFTDTFTSSGLPSQSFVLSGTPYLDVSDGVQVSTVTASNGTFTQAANFLGSGPTDKNFVITVDQNQVGTLLFGDGNNGLIPTGSITANCRSGGGIAGNVITGAISQISGSFTDTMGNPVTPTVTNAAPSQGGNAPETINHIKYMAPLAVRTTDRCVTKEDFEIHALAVPGVARTFMATSNEDSGIAENTGILFTVPQGGGIASPTLLANVLTQITVTFPCTITFKPSAQTATYFAVNVFARVYKLKGTTGAQMGATMRAALAAYFAILQPDGTPNPLIDFGANLVDVNGNPDPELSINALLTTLETQTGVREIGGNPNDFTLNAAHADLTIPSLSFPILGTITVIDGDTGLPV